MNRICAAALLWSWVAAPAAAEAPPPPVHVRSAFWDAARNPDAPRVAALLRQGRARLQPALGLGFFLGTDALAHRRAGLENALARFERALSIDPNQREALYLSGKALGAWERRTPQGQTERRTREAIASLERLSRVDPFYEAEDVSFELGVLYTREGDFARAVASYERALALRLDNGSRSVLLGNLAEVTMMREDLEGAAALYEQAIAEGNRDERVLALWGLAITLDRLGEQGESMERARQALREDQRPLGALRQASVFFVPPYEAHYYDGLGMLALAQMEATQPGKAEDTVRSFQHALDRAGSSNALLALKQVLTSLEDEGHRDLIEPLYVAVERTVKKAPVKAKPKAVQKAQDPEEMRAFKIVLLSVQSLRSFTCYLDQGGDQGPWAADARAHVAELSRWFSPDRRVLHSRH